MNKLRTFLNSDINLNFYIHNPTRKEYLHNKEERLFTKTKTSTNRDRIKNSLKVLSNNDFVIFSSAESESQFIQYRKDRFFLVFDYSYSSIEERSKLLHRMDYVLHKLKFKNKLNIWQKIAEDWQGYFRHTMIKHGISLEVYCGTNINLATDLGVMAFSEVYKLDGDFDMNIEFGSWKKFWV